MKISKSLAGLMNLASRIPWCDCGWPYNLLLPRGTAKGLECRLLVMLSPGTDLAQNIPDTASGECTSVSYCGARDNDYPDKKPMGYPFDRTLPDNIDSIIKERGNWASRKIGIRCVNPHLTLSAEHGAGL